MPRIPLFAKTEPDILAWAEVDEDDYLDLLKYTWYLSSDGIAARPHGERFRSMARHIMKVSATDPRQVLHRDGDKMNHRRENLAVVKEATPPDGN